LTPLPFGEAATVVVRFVAPHSFGAVFSADFHTRLSWNYLLLFFHRLPSLHGLNGFSSSGLMGIFGLHRRFKRFKQAESPGARIRTEAVVFFSVQSPVFHSVNTSLGSVPLIM